MTISKEVRVGLFMVVTLVLLYFGFNFLKGIDFLSSRSKYYAIYSNVDQLMPSNQIYLNGVSVGRVSRIQIQQVKNRVVVEMEIDSYVVLGDSSEAILNGDFLGTKFIQLNIGNFSRQLKPKDTLRSTVAKGITAILEESAVPVADNLQTTLRKLNTILDNLSRNSQKLDVIFEDFKATPGLVNNTIANANTEITQLSDSVQRLTGNLNRSLRKLDPTLNNFAVISDSLKSVQLNKTLSEISATLNGVNETLKKFNSGDNTVSRLMTEDSLYVNLNNLIHSIDSLANHFNQNPRHFMAPLGKSQKKIQRDLQKQRKEE
ncbi:MAG: MlaD family protein [Cyclobacteriaceae bacterium]|jgi:phospholipid/cholesterol/gamma-HCH transport system substrate-binding protein|nr:MlaD family protein [Cyclobacteriaceae bacterium]